MFSCVDTISKGTVVWIEDIPAADWPAWKQLLSEVEAVSRGCELLDRTLLCLDLPGIAAANAAAPDVCLESVEWKGIASPVDAWIFAARCDRHRSPSTTQTWLRGATIAHLSMWDPELAILLAELSTARLLAPRDALCDYAQDRSWAAANHQSNWHDGSAEVWEGRVTPHSAWLAAHADARSVERRLWKAQAQALLPFLEEQRAELVHTLARFLTLPFTPNDSGAVITELADLELGHIQFDRALADSFMAD